MTRVAIVCPGPSLHSTWGRNIEHYDLVFGVNVTHIIVDYQVSSDWQTLPMLTHAPRLGWVVPKATLFYHPSLGPIVITYESFADMLPMTPPQCNFSGVAALIAASTFRADTIDVYGMDLVATPEPGRDEARFRRERQHVADVRKALAAQQPLLTINWIRP